MPCSTAITKGQACTPPAPHETVSSADLTTDQRWPRWAPRAANAGIGAVLSVPLHAGYAPLGAMTMYSAANGVHSPHHLSLAVLAASHLSAILEHQRVHHHLTRAVEARTTIGQAQGILMERFTLTDLQAFAALRRYSQDQNSKIHDIAAEIITTRTFPAPSPHQHAPHHRHKNHPPAVPAIKACCPATHRPGRRRPRSGKRCATRSSETNRLESPRAGAAVPHGTCAAMSKASILATAAFSGVSASQRR